QTISTTPLGPLLKPGAGYHYNPILLATIKEMYTFFGIQHVAAYHLLAYFLFWLSGVFVMLIARKLTGRTLAGALAGILFIGFGTQYEAAIWGVVAYGPAMSTVVYGVGLYCFMLAHDDWRSRGQRMLFYAGFMLALIVGPFIYEQDITLVAACLLYRVFVVDQDLWQSLRRAPRAIISRIPAYLADFAIPALFFVGYLAFKVILGRTYSASSGISETPGLSAPWDALTSTATTGVFQAFFPGLSINELSIITLSNIGPRYHLIVLAAVLIVMLIALVKIKPIYKFLLLWAVMTICAQTLGLANISSRHLMLMTVPTAMLWAGALVSLPGVFARWGKRLRIDPSLAWQAGYGVSVLALVLFMAKGYRYSQATQTDWRAAIWHVDATLATLNQYATADPVAQNVYLVNLPDYTPAITGQTMYEFRNSPSAIVMLTMPGRFTSVTAVRTANDFPINFGYTTYETESQLETLARTPSDLVLVYDLSSGQLEPFQAPHPLVEYYNAHTHDHWVTTSTEPLASGYVRQKTLAYLSPVDEPETIPIFGCVTATGDHFLSIQNVCEGATTLSLEGWLYTSAQANAPTVPVYRCRASSDHFISTQTSCDGGVYETLLGYGGADK
ncbi:MAG TPA: hypothetical protein VE338_09760, partial [Ktedonobacterales bacterium]|nr:hypothetical protein [Ktedonobacterales bacterium]